MLSALINRNDFIIFQYYKFHKKKAFYIILRSLLNSQSYEFYIERMKRNEGGQQATTSEKYN